MKRFAILAGLLVLSSTAAPAQAPAPIPAAYGPPISMADALALLQKGVALSKERGHKMAIAVVEPNGELVAFIRMDDAPYGAIDIAQSKALTSARFRMTTASAEERVQNGRMVLLSADGFIAIAGGVPLVDDGKVIGAIGISGASAAEDAALATALAASQ